MEAIRKGFGVATRNLGLVLILFVFNLIWNLASIPLAGPATAPAPQVNVVALAFAIIFILASIFVQGGSLGLVRDYLKAGSMKLAGFAKYGAKYYLRLLGLGIIIVLIIAIVGLVAALIVAATAPLNNTVVTTVAGIVSIIIGALGLYTIFLLIFSPYSAVCDEIGIMGAMKASMRTVRRSILKVLLLLILLVLISLGIGFVVGFLVGLVTVAMPAQAGQIVIGIVNSIFNSYLGVVMTASFMAFYLALAEKEKTSAAKVF